MYLAQITTLIGVLRKRTNQAEQNKCILRNKAHCKCISSLREVINAINSEEEYANLATTFIIKNNNYLK